MAKWKGAKGSTGTGEVLVPCLGDVGAEALFWRECCRYWEAAGEAGRTGLLELSQEGERAPALHHGCPVRCCIQTWLDLVLT